jgi:DNA-binding transcriptional regulator YiaG
MTDQLYHYRESGLEDVYLANGFELVRGADGLMRTRIEDIDGLHDVIGRHIVNERKMLSGSEIRFLRHELLLSQGGLAHLLDVAENTVRRWEHGRQVMPRSADVLLRALYMERSNGRGGVVPGLLQRLADLEDEIDRNLTLHRERGDWDVMEQAA